MSLILHRPPAPIRAAIAVKSMVGDVIGSMEDQSNNFPLVREVLNEFVEKQRKPGHDAQARL